MFIYLFIYLAASGLSCGRHDLHCETVYLKLGPELTCRAQTWPKPSLTTEITHLVSELNEAQVLDVSSQKEFSERQGDR